MSIDYKEVGENLKKKYIRPYLEQEGITAEQMQEISYETGFFIDVATSALDKHGAALFDPARTDDINRKIIENGLKEGTIKKKGEHYIYNLNNGKDIRVDTYGMDSPCLMACFVAHETFEVAKERNPQAKEIMEEVEKRRQKAGRERTHFFQRKRQLANCCNGSNDEVKTRWALNS